MPWSAPTADTSSSKPGDKAAQALAAVRRYVRGHVRSTQAVRSYLLRRGVPSRVRERVIADCRTQGWLDDRAGAQLWAETWARRGYAWTVIHARLIEKGFDESAVQFAATHYSRAADDEARARRLTETVLLRGRHLPSARPAARVARTLASRGFDSSVIERVLREVTDLPPAD